MMKKLVFVFLLVCNFGIAQNLEEDIYSATEAFISNQNPTSYSKLKTEATTFRNQLKTKDEQLAFVFLLCNTGYYAQNKLPSEAISSYEEAWSRYTKYELSKLSDFDIIENCLKPLGNLYTKNGDYTNAENIIKHYIFLAEQKQDKTQQMAGAINLAKLYQTLGKHETVISIVDNAHKIPNINSEQKQKLESIKNFSLIEIGKIKSIKNDTVSINSKNYNEIEYQLALKNQKYDKALNLFQIKKSQLKNDILSTRTKAKLNVEEAQLNYLSGKTEDALESLKLATETLLPNFQEQGLPQKEYLYADNTFIDIFDLLARLQPNSKQALGCYNLSTYVSDLMYDGLTSQQSKIENLASNRLRSENCIDLLFSEYEENKNISFFEDALQYAEDSKAQILKDVFKKKSLLEQFPNDTLLIKEQHLLKEQERITNLLINEQLGSSKASKINELSKQLNTISIDLKSIKTKISKAYPEEGKTKIDIKKLQEKLTFDDATLVAYFYGNKVIYQFIISSKSIGFNKIELSEANKNRITTFNGLFENASIINNDILNFTNQSYNLYKLLHFDEVSSTKNVIVIPDGLLNFTPFEALLTSETTSTNYTKMPFVITKQTILYNTSISFYFNQKNEKEEPNVLGVFPVFDNSNQKLTFSIKESENLKEEIHSTLLMNDQASKQNFIDRAKQFNTLHLSTHAKAGSFSKPASISFYDEDLTLNELYSLNLNSDLVVLSACETGVGKVYKSEGAMSIARGFQYAGANNIMFTLWQINDLSTSQIISSFYKNYSKTESAYLANHQSKIDYLENENISNSKKSPYYWSAFVYYGNLEKPKDKNMPIYYWFGVLLIGIILFSILKRKQHG